VGVECHREKEKEGRKFAQRDMGIILPNKQGHKEGGYWKVQGCSPMQRKQIRRNNVDEEKG